MSRLQRSRASAPFEPPSPPAAGEEGAAASARVGEATAEAAPLSGEAARAAETIEVGWDHTANMAEEAAVIERPKETTSLEARLLSLLADPRVDTITAESAARALEQPRRDVETTLDAMTQAGTLTATGDAPRSYRAPHKEKQRLESMFRVAAHELSERGVLARTSQEDALAPLDDEVEEPRLPITAGLLSLFLPGTGQLLNGDVGRASLVFAVWSLAWITHLSPVWTFVSLYAGAEAFFTAKIRSMERKAAAQRGSPAPGPRALPPKPSST